MVTNCLKFLESFIFLLSCLIFSGEERSLKMIPWRRWNSWCDIISFFRSSIVSLKSSIIFWKSLSTSIFLKVIWISLRIISILSVKIFPISNICWNFFKEGINFLSRKLFKSSFIITFHLLVSFPSNILSEIVFGQR